MKRIRIQIVIAVVALAFLMAWLVRIKTSHRPSSAPVIVSVISRAKSAPTKAEPAKPEHHAPRNLLNVKRASEFTDEEKKELAATFATKLRPAAERWFTAYGDHVPFDLADLTLDKFVERIGADSSFRLYTFVIGDITFTIRESQGTAKVEYLMSREAAHEMNTLPTAGAVPNLSTPVARQDIIGMVQADSGVQFKPNEVVIHPAAAACALNGGEFVHTIPTGADPNNGLSSKLDLVFDSSGKLVNYDRDPFF